MFRVCDGLGGVWDESRSSPLAVTVRVGGLNFTRVAQHLRSLNILILKSLGLVVYLNPSNCLRRSNFFVAVVSVLLDQ